MNENENSKTICLCQPVEKFWLKFYKNYHLPKKTLLVNTSKFTSHGQYYSDAQTRERR